MLLLTFHSCIKEQPLTINSNKILLCVLLTTIPSSITHFYFPRQFFRQVFYTLGNLSDFKFLFYLTE